MNVLAGINTYLIPGNDLRGCTNDAENVRRLLRKLGVPEEEIAVILNAKATASHEKKLVMEMIRGSKSGDHLAWSHSSHGSNNPDPYQPDGLEELLCSYDILERRGEWDENTVITARWIGKAIMELHPEATLDILIDACHAPAGGQLKELGLSYSRARFLPRPGGRGVNPMRGRIKDGTVPPNVALWSACQPEQTSADAWIDETWQGAFTAAFLDSWSEGRCRSDIIHYARAYLKAGGWDQVPHLYCNHDMAMRQFLA